LVVNKTKDGNEEVQEDPDTKEKVPTALVNHPPLPPLVKAVGLETLEDLCAGRRRRALQALKTNSFGLVALEVNVLLEIQVRVVFKGHGWLVVGKVKAGRMFRVVHMYDLRGRKKQNPVC